MPLYNKAYAGQPKLPIKSFNLLLPYGAKATDVTITSSNSEVIPGSYYIHPIQPPAYPNGEEPPAFVEPDASIYNSNTAYPVNKLLNFKNNGFREYNYVNISFYPFSYDPLNRELTLSTNIEITVFYTETPPLEASKLRPYNNVDEKAYEFIKKNMLNGEDNIANFYIETTDKVNQYKAKGTNVLEGKAFTPTELPALAGSEVRYVIITNNTDINGNPVDPNENLVDTFQDFANWKTQNGTPAKVVTVDNIRTAYEGVDIPEKIRHFIQDAYQLWGTEYILLGGTANIIPVRWVHNYKLTPLPTDLYYAAICYNVEGQTFFDDNWNANNNNKFGEIRLNETYTEVVYQDILDYVPDIAVGRAPIDNLEEADTFINKNKTYARMSADTPTDTDWLNEQLNIGGIVYRLPWEDSVNCLPVFHYIETEFTYNEDDPIPKGSNQYTMLEYWSVWRTWDGEDDGDEADYSDWWPAYDTNQNGIDGDEGDIMDAKIYNGADGIDNDDIVSYISDNKPGIILHIDHSGSHNMGLTEAVVHSTTGLTAEDWQNLETTSHKYPIMISGGCSTAPIEKSFFVGGEWLNKKGGGVAYLGTCVDVAAHISKRYSKSIFDKLYDPLNSQNIFGLLKNEAVLTGNEIKDAYKTRLIYQLLGDPQLTIYTDKPEDLVVTTTNGSLKTGQQLISVTVSNIPEYQTATISIYKENEVIAVQQTSNNGVTLDFSITPDTTDNELLITVTCPNANPYIKSIDVNQLNDDVHLYISDITIYNDPDGIEIAEVIHPGQEVFLKIQLTNTGVNEATNISADLIVDDNVINTQAYSNIPSENATVNTVLFPYTAPLDSQFGTEIDLTLDIKLNGTSTFTEPFLLNTKSAKLDIGDRELNHYGLKCHRFINLTKVR